MKKLGIIGGAGPLAGSLLYETLIQESYALGSPIPEIVLINYPFTRGLSLDERQENEKTICQELQYCIHILAKSGVELGVVACNTLHLFFERHIYPSIQFCCLPEIVVKAAQEKKHQRLLILGSQNTCQYDLYQLDEIKTVYPSDQHQKTVDQIIDRILKGKILKEDSLSITHVIEKTLQQDDFEGIVLGCTEFPVLHHHYPILSIKPIYDSIKLTAKTLVGFL